VQGNRRSFATNCSARPIVSATCSGVSISSLATSITPTITSLAGPPGDADGPASAARFNEPVGLAIDGAGNLYVADQYNALVRKITPDGMVSTVAGQRGLRGVAAGPLPASLYQPFGLLLGKQGELYVTDVSDGVIVKVTLP
jgi:hypothetical protein